MESGFLCVVILWLAFGTAIVTNAARERKDISMLMVIFACIFTTPVGGLLYCLCFHHK